MSANLKELLEQLYNKYNHRNLIAPDPLQFVYKFENPKDMEIAGLFSAGLAYGRVEQIQKSLTDLFDRMDWQPYKFIRKFNDDSAQKLKGFKHRFNTAEDIALLCVSLQIALKHYKSLENIFFLSYNPKGENILEALENFVYALTSFCGCPTKGLNYLLVSPSSKSVCKRMNLYLRWMIRNDDVDTGLWEHIPAKALIVPVDVHIARLTQILGFHNSKNLNLKTAIQITSEFAKICPADPVKYDFALSRIGIVENCNGKYDSDRCAECLLKGFCVEK